MPTNLLEPITGLSTANLEKATATENDVLIGKTFYSGNNELKTGTSKSHVIIGASLWNNAQTKVDKEFFIYSGGGFTAQKSFDVCIYPYLFGDNYAVGTIGIQLNGSTIISVYTPDGTYTTYTTPKVVSVNSGDTISGAVWASNDWASFSFILEKA